MSIEIKREDIIQHGLMVLQLVGSHYICEVCIKSGNSCCKGCEFLKDGLGCQKRNTSCTAWLCGLQKFFLNQIELLDEWEDLWKQVPGQWFRWDTTPETIKIKSLLNLEQLDSKVGKMIAEEFELFVKEGGKLDKLERKLNLIFELRNSENIHSLNRR
ncbi:DNA mismatch repair protein [Peribacillus simplex]|uniref:DNA mismatch repair protein n=1 Tax=Peribacillus simplex TaxID=1478 RepID=UPI00298EC658|nr:DNA mismatch repair protein [Peribacillus simplex]MDW7613866.1 DNA mismatch repair protein [Peribacillus simplex]